MRATGNTRAPLRELVRIDEALDPLRDRLLRASLAEVAPIPWTPRKQNGVPDEQGTKIEVPT
jgi:hypothetical protein